MMQMYSKQLLKCEKMPFFKTNIIIFDLFIGFSNEQ